ncbi:hypothetical protein GOBAR_AA15777 [Gossypium barbadense]|uniref:Uncharacterized protein n=1 Tax=Gossypium barbadense TaxID=3634 RepID=A0A2P5XND8_GOSBA|nr:hypothetical protein GOBAR_AA15777 [Gossypium barbadense]
MASSISSEPSFRIEVRPDSRSEAESSLNRVANSYSGALSNRTHNVINSLALDSDLKSLMKEYFANFEKTLEVCTALKDCFEHAPNNHGIIESALKCYDEEDKLEVGTVEKNSVKALEELRRFKEAEEPFTKEFLVLKKIAHRRYESMQGKPIITTSAGALTVAIVPFGTWCNGCWKRKKEKIKVKKKLTSIMKIYGSSATTIRALVEQLEIKNKSLLHSVDYVLKERYTLKVGMDDINEKLILVTPIITDLLRETDDCGCKFRTDWEDILRQMMHML